MQYFSLFFNKVALELTKNGYVPLVLTLSAIGLSVSLCSACAFAAAGRVKPSFFVVFFLAAISVCHYLLVKTMGNAAKEIGFVVEQKLFSVASSLILFFALIALYTVILLLLALSTPREKPKKEKKNDVYFNADKRMRRYGGRVEEFELPVLKMQLRKLGDVEKCAPTNFKYIAEFIAQTEQNCPDTVKEKLKEINATVARYNGVCDVPVKAFNEFLPYLLKTWAKYVRSAS